MEIIRHKPLPSIWLKAAVAGSLWASVEIIAGSFLHNLNVPFTGAILSFFGVYLLIAFLQVWKENGLIWRAGLICALMKSISPSALILGPMIGICTEALLLELFIFLFGKNPAGYMVGGALAVFSTLVHLFFNLLILYGFDFVNILDSLYWFFAHQVHLEEADPINLVIGLSAVYLFAGMIAAFLGYRSGRLRIRKSAKPELNPEIELTDASSPFLSVANRDYSTGFLALNFCVLILSLFLFNTEHLVVAVMVALAYAGFCLVRYKRSLVRFRKISLWIQFIVVTLAAAFLLNGLTGSGSFSAEGLIIGLKMVLRAIIIILGFAAISIELRNPLIRAVLFRKGFANLYQSLEIAFSALPGIISALPDSRGIFRKNFFSSIFNRADILLVQFQREQENRAKVVIISGDVHGGKTTFAKHVIEGLNAKNFNIGGFLAPAVFANDLQTGYDLLEIGSENRTDLCRMVPLESWIPFGRYHFNPEGFLLGNELLDISKHPGKQLFVIDEVGPVEMKNGGWAKAMNRLCRQNQVIQLWIVRKSLVNAVATQWKVSEAEVFDIAYDTEAEVISRIGEIILLQKDLLKAS